MIKPERVEEIKELFQDLAEQSVDYYELESYVQGELSSGVITEEEYDYIVDQWDNWLKEAGL